MHHSIYNIPAVTSPRQRVFVFPIMQVVISTAVVHQRIGKAVISNRKFKLIRLYGAGLLRSDTTLYQLAFISFEDVPLFNNIIELPAFYTFAKYIQVVPTKPKANDQ